MEKQIIVDGRGHLVGRLASIVAKQLLNGEKIVVVRCEELNMSGSLFRNKLKFEVFLQKRSNTNPRRGAVKERSPSRVFFRAVRGMIPHKTVRGAEALARLTVTEGIPHPFDKKKRLVVPAALRNLRLRPGRRFCKLGDLSAAFGWKYQPLIAKLEAARKVRSAAHYKRAKAIINLRAKAVAAVDAKIPDDVAKLAQLGYLSSA